MLDAQEVAEGGNRRSQRLALAGELRGELLEQGGIGRPGDRGVEDRADLLVVLGAEFDELRWG